MGFRDDLIEKATAEWNWFGKDEGRADHFILPNGKTTALGKTGGTINPRKETVEPYSSRIADYWLAIPSSEYDRLVRSFAKAEGRLDGTIDIAWSAAFISYCMQIAGAGPAFPYASGHAVWIVKSIANHGSGKLRSALVGFKPGEIPLQPGDLIGKSRTAGVNYDNAVAKGWFESHSDIVVEVDLANRLAYTIGGNVGQTVSRAKVTTTEAGALNDPGGWIVHIRNNITSATVLPRGARPTAIEARVG